MSEHFYTSISKYYQHIFPANPEQIRFLSRILPYNGVKVLDVGCATGDLSFALTRFGFPIWAFDFDAVMMQSGRINFRNCWKKQDSVHSNFAAVSKPNL